VLGPCAAKERAVNLRSTSSSVGFLNAGSVPGKSLQPTSRRSAYLDYDHEPLLPLIGQAKSQVEQLLQQIPAA